MMRFGLYTYPWNVHDVDADVEHVRALGAGAIALATSYHAGKFLQPGDPKSRVYFPEDGTVYFTPDAARYELLKPQRAAQAHDRIGRLAAHDDIAVDAWTVLNHNSRLGFAHPEVVARNCFGDPYYYSLCPAHPEVRAYGIALCTDIAAQYLVERLLIETPGWLTYAHGYHHEFAQMPPNAWLDAMLGLCFCDSCRTGLGVAGIDADAIARDVAVAIDACLADTELWDDARQTAALTEWRERLAPYHAWRAHIVTRFVADIRAAVRQSVTVKIISTTQRPHATTYLEGHDLAALHDAADGLELPLYQPSTAAVADDLAYVLEQSGGPDRISAILRPGYPDMVSEDQLNDTLDRVRAAGITDISFYNFAMLRPANLGWLTRSLARLGV